MILHPQISHIDQSLKDSELLGIVAADIRKAGTPGTPRNHRTHRTCTSGQSTSGQSSEQDLQTGTVSLFGSPTDSLGVGPIL